MSLQSIPGPYELLVAAVLRRFRTGSLTVEMPHGREYVFSGSVSGPDARIELRDRGVARRLISGGSVALAEAYMDGAWDSPDLDTLLDFGIANEPGWRSVDVMAPLRRLAKPLPDNDIIGSKRNIEYHYDLGNDFYSLWLDPTMTYSAACFEDADELEAAQRRKWDRILDLLQPSSRDRILEIGCGWGGFAIHAAREAGCRVTGLTLSEEQAAFAKRNVEESGLDGRVEIALRDYRHEPQRYSGIASIEMFEAVGQRWWPVFFGRIRDLLQPGAAAAIQVITIDENTFERYAHNPDFTQRYIFPGGMLPSPERFAACASGEGLELEEPRFFGRDYARTLAEWRKRFECSLDEVRALGFDERFIRMWRYYLAYCRAGFDSGVINVMQVRMRGR